jgi:chemotaxis protein CheC
MVLTPMQLDILQELINIGVGRAAGMLNRMVSTHIQLQVPELVVLSSRELIHRYAARGGEVFSAVQLTFSGHFSGMSALIFPPESASRLVNIILGNSVVSPGSSTPCAWKPSRKWATSCSTALWAPSATS